MWKSSSDAVSPHNIFVAFHDTQWVRISLTAQYHSICKIIRGNWPKKTADLIDTLYFYSSNHQSLGVFTQLVQTTKEKNDVLLHFSSGPVSGHWLLTNKPREVNRKCYGLTGGSLIGRLRWTSFCIILHTVTTHMFMRDFKSAPM